jgi:hypothetical protein
MWACEPTAGSTPGVGVGVLSDAVWHPASTSVAMTRKALGKRRATSPGFMPFLFVA